MKQIASFLKSKSIFLPISFLGLLIVVSASAVYYNNRIMISTLKTMEETASIKENMNFIIRGIVQRADVSVRGFSVDKDERLLKPYTMAKEAFPKTFDDLNKQLAAQGVAPDGLEKIKTEVANYLEFSGKMIEEIKQDSMRTFRAMFKEDRGTALWHQYDAIAKNIIAREDELNQVAQFRYENAMVRTTWVQALLVLTGLPTLIFIILRLTKEANERRTLLREFDRSNRTYLFDDGIEVSTEGEGNYIDRSISSFKDAAAFVADLTNGKFDVEWPGLNEHNASLNSTNLAGKLAALRNQLRMVKQEDEERNWLNVGLAKFNEVVRSHQNSMADLSYQTVVFLCRYMNATQGSLFLVKEEAGKKRLELSACYAYNRKKYLSKSIELGEGLLGQTYLEGETTLLTDLPPNYTYITSGLGGATPSNLVIVPLKFNEEIEAMLELAGFQQWREHEIDFLEKAGVSLASVINNVTTSQKMKEILKETQEQAERLRSQEEELRQNLEEMQATQEQFLRNQANG